jgi:hypothetical protein
MDLGTGLIITESHDVYQERVTLFARITCVLCGFEKLGFESWLLIRNFQGFEVLDYGYDESGLVVRGMRVGFENHDYGSRNRFDNHRIT